MKLNTYTTIAFILGAVLPSLLIAWTSVFFVRRWATAWGLIDQPGLKRKAHTTPTPLGGGLAIWLGVILPFALGQVLLMLLRTEGGFSDFLLENIVPAFAQEHVSGLAQQSGSLWILLGAGTVLMIVGLIDDRRGLDWKIRLFVQFVVAAVCVYSQGWRLTAFIQMPLVTGLFSVMWIVAMINSFNMLDNMDGLSGGVAAIAAAMLAAVLLLSPDPVTQRPQLFVAGLLLVVVGGLLGFLLHNRPPAKIFMGDAGSYFVGFCIAVATLLATYASYHSESRHAVLAPLCVMAVPLYDMLSVLWIRFREGRSPFQADRSHFSHRLVDLGFSKGQAVLTIYLLTATCGLGALLLHQVNFYGACIIVLMILCVLALIAIIETTAGRKLKT